MFTHTEYPFMYYFLVPFSIFNLVVIFIHFKFKIAEGSNPFICTYDLQKGNGP